MRKTRQHVCIYTPFKSMFYNKLFASCACISFTPVFYSCAERRNWALFLGDVLPVMGGWWMGVSVSNSLTPVWCRKTGSVNQPNGDLKLI